MELPVNHGFPVAKQILLSCEKRKVMAAFQVFQADQPSLK
jgi:hypothetical protein